MSVQNMGATKRKSAAKTMTVLSVVIALVIAGTITAVIFLNKTLYGPSAFVQNYLSLLVEGRAADALEVPGVLKDGTTADVDGSPVLLRKDAVAPLSNIKVISERSVGSTTQVTVRYTTGDRDAESTFSVIPNGWDGLAPAWKFSQSPLATLAVTVPGSMDMSVNGFAFDKRQVSPAGLDVDPDAPLSLVVFTPGAYTVSVDNALSSAAAATFLVNEPLSTVDASLTAAPTAEFLATVQSEVDSFLQACVDQSVLLPAGCPFGLEVQGRIDGSPIWTISTPPAITLIPDGSNWIIEDADGVATIDVTMVSLFDGSKTQRNEKVSFTITGTVTVLSDGTPAVRITSTEF